MKIVELIIDPNDEQSGIDAISLVETPAIESNFIALSKQKHELYLKEINSEKKILMGAALIPDKSIYRRNDKGENTIFTFLKTQFARQVNYSLKNRIIKTQPLNTKIKLMVLQSLKVG